jgi:uncharacterized protein YhaN
VETQQTETSKLGKKDRTIVDLEKLNEKLKEEISSLENRVSKLTLKCAEQNIARSWLHKQLTVAELSEPISMARDPSAP